ncbi:ABC transporter permease/M1 family aminopeptidase [Rhodanobacter aciditrophus]|uniref:ABC transporter permease/M1 family aminopeptidase n=1 Tax=Rhodanobacter aciditrophus TaxID=1623218 RepID=UPI003CE72761
MFLEILRFEWRQQLRAPLFWIVLAAMLGIAFALGSTDAVVLGGASGNVLRNAPLVIARLLDAMTVLGILLVVAFVAGAATRDFEQRTAELLFATPVSRRAFLGGRFLAGYLVLLAILAACALAIALGGAMPWVDAGSRGVADWRGYAWGFGVLVLPNLLFIAALLFLLAIATRSLLASYIGVIAFFVLQGIAGALSRDLDNRWLAAMLDPFAGRTVALVTRYWTADQTNHLLPALDGVLLFNRLLWLAVSALLLAACFVLFRTDREGLRLPRRRKRAEPPLLRPPAAAAGLALPRVGIAGSRGARFAQLRAQFAFDTLGVLRGAAFLVLLVLALAVMFVSLVSAGLVYGTPVWPVTHQVLAAINGSFSLPLMIVLIFYAGELVWRERAHGMAGVSDAFPTPDWVAMLAKFGALLAVIALMLATGAAAGMGWQLAHGYRHLEPWLYLRMLALDAIPFVLVAALALFLQVACNNRFLGYLLGIAWLVGTLALDLLHREDNLYNYAGAPAVPYSDMNGFGHFIVGALWFDAYWGCLALAMLVLAALLWVRGTGQGWRDRLREARARLHPALAVVLVLALLGFAGLGGFVYYNTHVLNRYTDSTGQQRERADYEKLYAGDAGLPQPRITAVQADVDIHPYRRRLSVRGHYTLVNKLKVPVTELFVNYAAGFAPKTLSFAPHDTVKFDRRLGVAIYRLKTPLAPGSSMSFDFTLDYASRGFTNGTGETFLVHNGTFFNNQKFPQFGYQAKYQLTDRNDRRKYGLKLDVPRMPPLGDEAARANTYIANDADWISFDTTVSTAADQIALAPGTLEKTWTNGNRRYFHYTMRQPMLNFFSYLSARYAVKSVQHKGVTVSVYYNPAHAFNVDRMIEAAQDSLDYYDSHYTPYQFRQLRILEFPDYAAFAQSFANTIPFSEAIGFIADLRDSSHVDYVYDVTAHEVAHQWWAHRVIGADMQGSTLLSESLAQYSSLMVMKHKYGAQQMHKFLRYELDMYLAGRAAEKVAEEPLGKVENQPYIHYRKGSLVFYALQDYVGEDKLDAFLRQFLVDYGFQQPPYVDSKIFVDALTKALGPQWRPMIDDFFWKITLFDDRMLDATARRLPGGKYEVTMKVRAGMSYADGKGRETKAAPDIPIAIGVFARGDAGRDGKPLYLEKRMLPEGDSTLTVTVDGKPAMAGIDPYNELIDKVPADNRRAVTLQ